MASWLTASLVQRLSCCQQLTCISRFCCVIAMSCCAHCTSNSSTAPGHQTKLVELAVKCTFRHNDEAAEWEWQGTHCLEGSRPAETALHASPTCNQRYTERASMGTFAGSRQRCNTHGCCSTKPGKGGQVGTASAPANERLALWLVGEEHLGALPAAELLLCATTQQRQARGECQAAAAAAAVSAG